MKKKPEARSQEHEELCIETAEGFGVRRLDAAFSPQLAIRSSRKLKRDHGLCVLFPYFSDLRSRKPEAGFTLLEVLVALAIVSIGLALVISLLSGSLRNVRSVQLKNRAIQHAETVMEMTLLDDSIKKPTTRTGDFPEDGMKFSVVINEVPGSTEQFGQLSVEQNRMLSELKVRLFSYTVEVMWPDSTAPDFRLRTLKIVDTVEPRLEPGDLP